MRLSSGIARARAGAVVPLTAAAIVAGATVTVANFPALSAAGSVAVNVPVISGASSTGRFYGSRQWGCQPLRGGGGAGDDRQTCQGRHPRQ